VSFVARYQASPGSQTSLREANRARVIDGLKRYGRLTQIELAGITGLPPATVSNIVKELTAAGILNTSITSRSGRRATLVSLARRLGIVALPAYEAGRRTWTVEMVARVVEIIGGVTVADIVPRLDG